WDLVQRVDAASDLREYHDATAHGLEQLDFGLHRLDFFPGRASLETGAVPARDEAQAVACEEGTQLSRGARELAAELDAVVSRLARFPQAELERRVVTELGHVVVRPADGIDSQPDRHCYRPVR